MGVDSREMRATVRTFLFRPREFFEGRADRLSGVRGAALALVLALVTTAVIALSLWAFSTLFDAEVGTAVWGSVVGALPLLVLAFLALWVALAVVLHVGAWLGRGDGRFGATLEVTAWGMVPLVAVAALAGLALVAFTNATEFPASSGTPLADARSLQRGLTGLTFLLLQIGGAVWQAVVWAAGLRVAHGISRRAAVVVGVLVATALVLLS